MNEKKKEKIKNLKNQIKQEWKIIESGIKLIRDCYNYKRRSIHGVSNQEYENKMNDVVQSLVMLLTKVKVYEIVLADTFMGWKLKQANKLHIELIKFKEGD